jgi:hypothetical protein
MKEFFTSDDHKNWLFEKYYYAGANLRLLTFQAALGLLSQKGRDNALIIETGCQRQKDDVGAGMSTSIFGEYIFYHGGRVITVDNYEPHLIVCQECTQEWIDHISYVLSDSLSFLSECSEAPDLLYLDSLDYPIGEEADNVEMRNAAQLHCLSEFKAIEDKLKSDTILLADDNQLPGGGKPKLLKEYLIHKGWKCILDFQQTLWVKEI